jgi:hypothetical protein
VARHWHAGGLANIAVRRDRPAAHTQSQSPFGRWARSYTTSPGAHFIGLLLWTPWEGHLASSATVRRGSRAEDGRELSPLRKGRSQRQIRADQKVGVGAVCRLAKRAPPVNPPALFSSPTAVSGGMSGSSTVPFPVLRGTRIRYSSALRVSRQVTRRSILRGKFVGVA